MWQIITKTGEPVRYQGAVIFFPDMKRAQQFAVAGDQIVKVETAARR